MKRHHCVILEWELEIVEWELDLGKTSWNHVSSPPNLILFSQRFGPQSKGYQGSFGLFVHGRIVQCEDECQQEVQISE